MNVKPVPTGVLKNNINEELKLATERFYVGIIKINLKTGKSVVLHSLFCSEDIAKEYNWDEFISWYVQSFMVPEDYNRAFTNFCVSALQKRFKTGEHIVSMNFTFLQAGLLSRGVFQAAQADWNGEQEWAYVMVKRADEDTLLNSIVEQYVYNNCDYFIYLDAKNNSYVMFSSSDTGTPLPPIQCDDYETEIVKYAVAYVEEEDRDMVIREMHLSHVLEVLNRQGLHSFSCGIKDPTLGYTRKRLDYRYHDKSQQMILLSRTDITQFYLEQKKHLLDLESALLRAQSDPLTGLLNYQSTVDKITDCLSTHSQGYYAFMFIDLDDFKQINDSHGHPVGELLLREVSDVLKKNSEKLDVVGRVGGDEFVFFKSYVATVQNAEQIAQTICNQIEEIELDQVDSLSVSCSIGISIGTECDTDYQTLLKRADQMVYKAKSNGKGQFFVK